ncbi:MAG: hypothetical protein ACETVZ_05765, partial [Phycisphaerae bacterium]
FACGQPAIKIKTLSKAIKAIKCLAIYGIPINYYAIFQMQTDLYIRIRYHIENSKGRIFLTKAGFYVNLYKVQVIFFGYLKNENKTGDFWCSNSIFNPGDDFAF